MRHRHLLVPLIAICAACAAPIDTSVNVTNPAPRQETIRDLAILPVTVDAGLEEYGQLAASEMFDALRRAHPSLRLTAPSTSQTRLETAELTDDYARLVTQYTQTGEVDASILTDLGSALDATHLLALRLLYGEETGYGPGDFTGGAVYRGQTLRMGTQVWNTRTGAVTWRAIGDVSAVSGDVMRRRTVPDLIRDAVPELAEALPASPRAVDLAEDGPPGIEDRTLFFGSAGAITSVFLVLLLL